ncbi:MAG: histidine kinase [Rhodobacteraceae bacterium CG17_big_fil_post_rev_8_21_14_2_50_63_15]|nr:histidine kinase [Roseovarius sp.]PIV79790.1 MAG: histidine kinase [Rhodobacteraceae bacterium CG17_big_fil_post_rev_8_21_14_2_50_63_15]
MSKDKPAANIIPSADQLRMSILSKEMAEMDKQDKQRAKREEELRAFTQKFLTEQVTDDERELIQKLVMNAAANNKFEALVYSFPSDLCTDSGRAINNRLPHWPDTLQGKAKELYDRYISIAKPQGFKLKATIINFPKGMPGDVGFFLNWAPDEA